MKKAGFGKVAIGRPLFVLCGLLAMWGLDGCSKSPTGAVTDAANAAGGKLMEPLAQKDASRQAQKLANMIEDRPECQQYRNRLFEAGNGSPVAGTTQMAFVETMKAAGEAGCRKKS